MEDIAFKTRQEGGISLQEMERVCETVIAEEGKTYNRAQLSDIAELFGFVRLLKEPDAQIHILLQCIYDKSDDIRSMGLTFGFPILTIVGNMLCDFVQEISATASSLSLQILQLIECHIMVIKATIDLDVRDENDPIAIELISELQATIEKLKLPPPQENLSKY